MKIPSVAISGSDSGHCVFGGPAGATPWLKRKLIPAVRRITMMMYGRRSCASSLYFVAVVTQRRETNAELE